MNRALLSAVLTALIALPACGKSERPKKDFLPPTDRPTYAKVEVPPEPDVATAAPAADTWAGKTKETVRTVLTDLQKCRNDFLIPFQFNKMRRRDVTFVSLQEMDEVCAEGNREKKTRGAKRILRFLAEEHIGKHPDLDRFIALATDTVETYNVFSFMTKKVGSPEIEDVTKTAEECRARILEIGSTMDRLAAEIEKWPDGQVPDDDPQMVGREVDLAAFRQQLAHNYGFFLGDLTNAYDRYAAQSWQGQRLPKMGALKTWVAIPTKRLQQDRARLAQVKGADDKAQAELRSYLDAVEGALKAVAAGYDRYEKVPKEERAEKDPNRKNVEAAQKAVVKFHAGWGVTEANAR